MIILIVTVLAFILEFIFNSLLYKSILIPLVVISSLILLEPFFEKNKSKYLIYCFLIGLLYDIVYTGNYFLNASMFLIIGVLVVLINKNTPNNLFITLISLILLICTYRTLCFLFLGLLGVIEFSSSVLLKSIYTSLIFNIIYSLILYLTLYFISKKFNIKRIN